MTRYFTAWDDFDVDTIGTNVAAWTLRGGGAPTYKPQYSTAAILPYKRRYLEFLTDATTDYHAITRDVIDADSGRATFDIVFAFAMSLQTVEELHIYARGAGAGTMTDFVRARIVLATGAIYIDTMIASTYTAGHAYVGPTIGRWRGIASMLIGGSRMAGSGAVHAATTSAGTVTLTAGHAYFGRFRGNAGALNLRIWDASLGMSGEPSTWNLSPTGITAVSAGWIGFGGRHSTLTGKVAAFNFQAVGTASTFAVCPRTNTEYSTWLNNQRATRVIVAKMRFTGYDSSGSPYTATRKVYLSNYGYTSAQQDSPSLQHFDNYIVGIPTFSRQMPAALTGQAQVSFGKLQVRNNRR